DGITFSSEADKNKLLAEAYFIRSHTYFSLLRIWGEVPLEIVPTESDAKEMLPRSSVDEVMSQVLADVSQGIEFSQKEYPKKAELVKQRPMHLRLTCCCGRRRFLKVHQKTWKK